MIEALSTPNWVKIGSLLQLRMLGACEIREALGPAPASKHLRIWKKAGVVTFAKERL